MAPAPQGVHRQLSWAANYLGAAKSVLDDALVSSAVLDDLGFRAVVDLTVATQHLILAMGSPSKTSSLLEALYAWQDEGEPHTAEEAASGSSVVFPHRTHMKAPDMLKASSFANLNTVLIALVNAGGVRPEDSDVVSQALAELKTDEDELHADEATLADHEKRIAALEDGVNGLADTLDPAASAASTATVETAPAGSGSDTLTLSDPSTAASVETAASGAGTDTATLTASQNATAL